MLGMIITLIVAISIILLSIPEDAYDIQIELTVGGLIDVMWVGIAVIGTYSLIVVYEISIGDYFLIRKRRDFNK